MLKEGFTLALLSGVVVLLVEVLWINLELVIYRENKITPKGKTTINTFIDAMHTRMMCHINALNLPM